MKRLSARSYVTGVAFGVAISPGPDESRRQRCCIFTISPRGGCYSLHLAALLRPVVFSRTLSETDGQEGTPESRQVTEWAVTQVASILG